jgi:phosphohistidine phosphatase SixA
VNAGQGVTRFVTSCLTVTFPLVAAAVFAMPSPSGSAERRKAPNEDVQSEEAQSSSPTTQGERINATPDKKALVRALQQGGYVLYLRHAITDRSRIDADRTNLQNCATQRNLSHEGQQQAKAIGKAIQSLGLAIGEVLASPYCRCIDTAKLAFGKFMVSTDLVWVLGQPEAETQRLAKALRTHLGTRPSKGTNTVLVSHTANLKEAVGIWPEPEGSLYIFLPGADGGTSYVGKIAPEEWAMLTPAEE